MKRKRQDESRVWCNVCKIWLANNRAQREQHQAGLKHRTAQAQLIKDIANRNEERRKNDVATKTPEEVHDQTKKSGYQLLEQAMKVTTKDTRSLEIEHHNNTGIYPDGQSFHPQKPQMDVSNSAYVQEKQIISTSENVKVSDAMITDDSGFPLPANEIYGTWETHEPQDQDEHHNSITNNAHPTNQPKHGAEGGDLHTPNEVKDIRADFPRHVELGGPSDADPGNEPSISFKKKLAPRNRRKKI